MSDTLTVDVNRTSLHSVEAPDSFSSTGSFDVELINHGEAVHVHVHIDDTLSEAASIEAINHHLRPGAVRRVPVAVHRDDRSASGRLKLVSAYGAETRYVDLSLQATRPTKPPVEVDAALSRPAERTDRTGRSDRNDRNGRRSRSASKTGSDSRLGSGSGARSRTRSSRGSAGGSGSGPTELLGGIDAPAAALGVGVLFVVLVAIATIDSALLLAGAFVLLVGIAAAGYVSLR